MLELYPIDKGASNNVPNTDATVHRAVEDPLRIRLRKANVVNVVRGSLWEISDSLEACLRV